MKKPNSISKVVTEEILDKKLSAIEKNMNQKFDQVIKELDRNQKIFRLEIMSNTLDSRHILEKRILEFKDEMFTKIDPFLSEIENSRLDRELSTEETENLKSRIKVLEEKIKRLESSVKPN